MSSTEIGMTVIEEESIEIASTPDSEISEKIKSGSPRQKNQDTGEDQDTDLELEEEKEEFDVTGRNQYLSVCRTLGVVPSSYFLRHMQDSTLSLRHHGIGSPGAKAISYPLMNNTTVVKLDLQDNWLEGEGGESIARMLKENCYITDLDISENRLSSKGAKALCNMLTSNTTLKRINLSGNLFSDRDAGYFFEAFSENSRLKYVNLSHNEFSDNAAVVLGQAIAENETIEELDLSWNFFRRGSTLKLCEGIWSNCRLKEINLSMNGFGDEGALAVAEILKRSITLYVMDISYNRISRTGATAIGKALDQNDALRTLRIGHNPFGVEGAKDILKGVACEHCVITQLDLSGIEVDKEFRELKQVLEETKELQVTHGVVLSDYVIKVKPKKGHDKNMLKSSGVNLFKRLRGNVKTIYPSVFTNSDMKKRIKRLHDQYVLVPADKADFYVYRIMTRSTHGECDGSTRDAYFSKTPDPTSEAFRAKEQMFGVHIADITPSNILQVIKQYSHEKDIKLGDMFINLDRKKMGSVTIQEFIQGLQSCGLEIQESQMSTLVDLLDAIAPENLINYSIFKSK